MYAVLLLEVSALYRVEFALTFVETVNIDVFCTNSLYRMTRLTTRFLKSINSVLQVTDMTPIDVCAVYELSANYDWLLMHQYGSYNDGVNDVSPRHSRFHLSIH